MQHIHSVDLFFHHDIWTWSYMSPIVEILQYLLDYVTTGGVPSILPMTMTKHPHIIFSHKKRQCHKLPLSEDGRFPLTLWRVFGRVRKASFQRSHFKERFGSPSSSFHSSPSRPTRLEDIAYLLIISLFACTNIAQELNLNILFFK